MMMSTTAGASLEGKSSVNTTKTQKLLYMFNILKEQGWIRKADVIGELGISDLAFWRYIQEIRSFFFDFYPLALQSFGFDLNNGWNKKIVRKAWCVYLSQISYIIIRSIKS